MYIIRHRKDTCLRLLPGFYKLCLKVNFLVVCLLPKFSELSGLAADKIHNFTTQFQNSHSVQTENIKMNFEILIKKILLVHNTQLNTMGS